MKRFSSIFLIVALFCSTAFSYSYSAYGIMTGKKTLALNPYVYAYDAEGLTLGADFLAAYGITNKIDVLANFGSMTFVPSYSYDSWYGMVRYDLKNNNIIALQGNADLLSLQYHTCKENHKAALQINLGVDFAFEMPKEPTFWAVVSPVKKIGSTGIDVYCDLLPSYKVNGDFSLQVIPGVGFAIKEHLFSLGVSLGDVTTEVSPSVGLWWYYSISFEK